MSKLNLLLVNDFYNGGGAEGVFRLTESLMQGYYNVFIYTAHQNISDTHKNPVDYIYSTKHEKNIINLIKEKNIDIVHVHNYRWVTPAVFNAVKKARKKAGFTNIKLFHTAHDYTLVSPNSANGFYKNNKLVLFDAAKPGNSFLFKKMDNNGILHSVLKKLQWYNAFDRLKLYKQINTIISPSKFLLDVIAQNYPDQKFKLIRNPFNIKKDIAVDDRQQDTDILKLVFIGRIAEEKGIDLLVSMINKVIKQIPFKLLLDIYGSGPMVNAINKLIADNGLSGIVNYKGFISPDKIDETLKQYDALVMSSIWYENAPLSIVEASFAGLKLVIPDMGGMKEMAGLCGNDFYYTVNDILSLQHALTSCINKNFTNQNIPSLKQIFSPEKYVAELNELYNS